MDNQESELQTLRALVRDVVARVERLERSAETRATAASEPSLRPETQASVVPLAPSSPASSQVPATETPAMPPPNTFSARPLPPSRPAPRASDPQFATAKPEIDLESRIGSHWLNRIGISAVLLVIRSSCNDSGVFLGTMRHGPPSCSTRARLNRT